jgi:hypothetical protein
VEKRDNEIVKIYLPITDREGRITEINSEVLVQRIAVNQQGDSCKLFIGPLEIDVPKALWEQLKA